jgi:2,4-dienoyl-CoA reductase-like NADH-dependent reductase (Old Yellow Enzyme family)/thioredoxin reductase
MALRYEHTLAPLRVGGRLLKSRFLVTRSVSGAFQGDENYPTEAMISHMAELARSGAAIVTCQGADWKSDPFFGDAGGGFGPGPGGPKGPDTWGIGSFDGPGMGDLEIETRGCKLYYSHMTDEIHLYGSLASASMMGIEPRNLTLSEAPAGMRMMGPPVKTHIASTEELEHLVELLAQKAHAFQQMGFDMVSFYMSYGNSLLAKSLSPVHNKRTDRFGEKTALTTALFRRVKELCGKDFLIEAQVSGEELGGYTLEDFVGYTKQWEGLVDILQLRAPDMDLAHPTGLNSQEGQAPLTLRYAQAVKEADVQITVAPNGGFQDLDEIEGYIREGKMDMAAVARAFICDPEYGKKALEGRGEDVVPCLRCNRCHCRDNVKCYVNPRMGLEHKIERMFPATATPKKVAIIGGGPAGMWAALECRRRGHTVDLFEQNATLGGQMFHADYADFKWPMKHFKDYLIAQMDRQQVTVHLNTAATPELIAQGSYDAVIAAVGAVAAKPQVAGAEDQAVFTPLQVFGKPEQLGHRVIVVGGSETGTETALYLARCGHQVTILTRRERLATDAQNSHYYGSLVNALRGEKELTAICKAKTTGMTQNSVTYTAEDGSSHTLEADSVVACGGMTPLQEEATAFAGIAPRFFAIGDCNQVGNIHTCTRSAFSAAMQI